MRALLFPGQGSQSVGMGKELFENSDLVKKIFNQADDILKFKISKIILDGPKDEINKTENTQPAILLVSYSIFKFLESEGKIDFNDYNFFCGHSLGEYSALVCSNSLRFDDALHLLRERGKAMQECVKIGNGKMIAVLGCEYEKLIKIIEENKGDDFLCEVANDNSIGQIILSGLTKSIDKIKEKLKSNNVKCVLLPVSAPFHCSLMNPASEIMKGKIEKVRFEKPKVKIVSNVTAVSENEPSKIKQLLVKQIYSKVRWRESVNFMANNNTKEFVEIGPGKVLSGLVKRTLENKKIVNLDSLENIKNY